LADEKSKKTYLAMIYFRQTHRKKDYPFLLFENNIYFIDEIKFQQEEVFIDCGAYNGDTIKRFLNVCQDYKQIIAFEPEQNNFFILYEKFLKNPKITLINAGTSDVKGEASFVGIGIAGRISTDDEKTESTKIKTQTIDNLKLEKVTFIKMDVEGAELNSLKGAEKTIIRDKPKLAISIYHSNEDMIDIAEYIHKIVPEYKLYVRQHIAIPTTAETVLYGVIAN